MAKKTFCDACGREVIQHHIGKCLDIPLHIVEEVKGRYNIGYLTNNNNDPVYGRFKSYDLCLRCSNEIMRATMRKLLQIQERNGIQSD